MKRAEVIALAALKAARKAVAKPSVRGPQQVVREIVVQAPAPPAPSSVVTFPPATIPQPVGILDVEVEQNDLDVFFIITLTDGSRLERRVTLPKPKKGKDGKDGDSKPLMMRTYQVPAYITAAEFLPDNKLKLTFSDGTIVTTATGPTATIPALATRTVTSDTTALDADDVIIVNSASPVIVTLMSSASRTRLLYVKRVGTGLVTIQRAGSDTIDGDTSVIVSTQYTSITLAPGWYIV